MKLLITGGAGFAACGFAGSGFGPEHAAAVVSRAQAAAAAHMVSNLIRVFLPCPDTGRVGAQPASDYHVVTARAPCPGREGTHV